MDHRWLTAAATVLAVSAVGGSARAQSVNGAIPPAMHQFVDALAVGDQEQVMSFFSTSDRAQALVPDSVWALGRGSRPEDLVLSGYLRMLKDLVSEGGGFRAADALTTTDAVAAGTLPTLSQTDGLPGAEMVRMFEDRLGVRVLPLSPTANLLIFAVEDDTALHAFDGAEKGAAKVLQPAERRTLGLAAPGDPEPFVTFWQEEGERGDWRIMMVGMLAQ